MNESDWECSDDPERMISFLRDRIDFRRLRLFACGCCRMATHLLVDPRSQESLLIAERFADGSASNDELEHAAETANVIYLDADDRISMRAANAVYKASEWGDEQWQVMNAWKDVALALEGEAFARAAGWPATNVDEMMETWAEAWGGSGRTMGWTEVQPDQDIAKLLRCIVGNPFRPVPFAPEWRSPTVVALADAIYAERAFDRLPVLADALEEAGCDHPAVLAHCRDPGPHARGCWVVDGVLGKT